jgi:hypothetical protein
MQAEAVRWQRLIRSLYFGIAGFLAGEILMGIPLIWPALSDDVWSLVVWSGASVMGGCAILLVTVVVVSGRKEPNQR